MCSPRSETQKSNEIIFNLFRSYLLAITLSYFLFLINNFSRALSIALNGQFLHAIGHLREGKKGSTLDVTPDLVNCRCQLVHLGKRVMVEVEQI